VGKSLEMSSGGLGFERFMKALVSVPKDEIDREIEKQKTERSAKKVKKIAAPRRGR
jgi:hypothetical protein